MFFNTHSDLYIEKRDHRVVDLKIIKIIIVKYPFKANEILLDRYCKQHFKKSLRAMCLYLISKLSISTAGYGNLIYTFKDEADDKIARLITYGNGKIAGSKILLHAFGMGTGKDKTWH